MRAYPESGETEYSEIIQPSNERKNPVRKQVKRQHEVEQGKRGQQLIARGPECALARCLKGTLSFVNFLR